MDHCFDNFPSLAASVGKSSYVGINIASTLASYSFFIKKHGRLFRRGEYWRTVTFSTVAVVLLSLIFVLSATAADTTTRDLKDIPVGGWVVIMALATLIAFGLNAIGYSSWFGNRLLKANRKKQVQIDTTPFR
ncbi:ABZJ_00895 family protein [Mesorhizobium sp. B1-1-8]|uniref:ABZJ_00895 family protein n=1 Tax=Mesorhizobium sp. B1-1-8 TaxID=2589976 RepID=UPI001AEEC3D2|nr:ABZJ_00895 family protein [Mesorhizobium sp. B1-1-8]UCI10138.1 ABZJ_00895 family protein [Mesorhizobium sp. B1-1-8]